MNIYSECDVDARKIIKYIVGNIAWNIGSTKEYNDSDNIVNKNIDKNDNDWNWINQMVTRIIIIQTVIVMRTIMIKAKQQHKWWW